MSTRIAINGFGRVGRAAFRAAYERELPVEWAGINDLADAEMLAHLLKYDSVYGRFPGSVEVRDSELAVDGAIIPVFNESDPARLRWEELGAEVVLEATGRFRSRDEAARHLQAGARKVVVSARRRTRTQLWCWASTSTTTTSPSGTTSSRTPLARRTALPRSRSSCTNPLGSDMA
jgi:glyceraldehyde 3-phosphate dehydrogenase